MSRGKSYQKLHGRLEHSSVVKHLSPQGPRFHSFHPMEKKGLVVHTFNPSIFIPSQAEAGKSTEWVPGQTTGLHRGK